MGLFPVFGEKERSGEGGRTPFKIGGCYPTSNVVKKRHGSLFVTTPVLYPFHKLQSEAGSCLYHIIKG